MNFQTASHCIPIEVFTVTLEFDVNLSQILLPNGPVILTQADVM